jgi:hypothetical protein
MRRRIFLGLVLAAVTAGGAFALPEPKLSVGAGGYFTSDFGGGVETSGFGQTMTLKTPYAGGGGFAFFDATYAELSLGIFGGDGKWKRELGRYSSETDMSYTGLDIGLLGKYPFEISEKFSVFPLLGITYRAMLSQKDSNGNKSKDPEDFSALWFRLGGGGDFYFTDHVYLRGGLLYGFRVKNTFEKDQVDSWSSPIVDAKARLGHGLELKIAVGYQF